MQIIQFLLIFAFSTTTTLAAPANGTDNVQKRQELPNEPRCGTAGDAILSDCKAMLSASNLALDYSRTCTVGLAQKAYNPICSPGNCCFYTTRDEVPASEVVKYGNMLLGCGDAAVNKVNGRVYDENNNQYCLSDGKGCNDCFED
ncbi:hypothetical protein FB451DRAFT_1555487 [Mycena latifolia]|nr:hypothetical protein FB451DRAFT_1555487 [Mycena latifolia]